MDSVSKINPARMTDRQILNAELDWFEQLHPALSETLVTMLHNIVADWFSTESPEGFRYLRFLGYRTSTI